MFKLSSFLKILGVTLILALVSGRAVYAAVSYEGYVYVELDGKDDGGPYKVLKDVTVDVFSASGDATCTFVDERSAGCGGDGSCTQDNWKVNSHFACGGGSDNPCRIACSPKPTLCNDEDRFGGPADCEKYQQINNGLPKFLAWENSDNDGEWHTENLEALSCQNNDCLPHSDRDCIFISPATDPTGSDQLPAQFKSYAGGHWVAKPNGPVSNDLNAGSCPEVQHTYEAGEDGVIKLTKFGSNVGDADCLDFVWVPEGASNQPPVCESLTAEPKSGQVPLEVNFSGTASSPDDNITNYTLDFGDGQTEPKTNSGKTLNLNTKHTYTQPGTYTATLRVCDAADQCVGSEACAATIAVTSVDNQPPRCLSLTAEPTSGAAPLTVKFTGTAEDPEGQLASYVFDPGFGKTKSGEISGGQFNLSESYTYEAAGTYTAKLKICDQAEVCDDGPQCEATVTVGLPEKFLNCEKLEKDVAQPQIGDTVKFTCNGSSYSGITKAPGAPIKRVRFKIYRDGVLLTSQPLETTTLTDRGSGKYSAAISYLIDKVGRYSVTSSVCLSTAAQDSENALCTRFGVPQGSSGLWRRILGLIKNLFRV